HLSPSALFRGVKHGDLDRRLLSSASRVLLVHDNLRRLWRRLRRSGNSRKTKRPSRNPRPVVLVMEPLEERWLPSITMTSQQLSFVEGTSATAVVATYTDTDANPPDAYAATIDWGDGTTTSGTISFDAGVFSISGDHAYADESDVPGLPVA